MMRRVLLVDTGALVAALNRHDRYHVWMTQRLKTFRPPLLTCEAVISETCFLLLHQEMQTNAVFEWLQNSAMIIPFHLDRDDSGCSRVDAKIRRCADVIRGRLLSAQGGTLR